MIIIHTTYANAEKISHLHVKINFVDKNDYSDMLHDYKKFFFFFYEMMVEIQFV